jgi:cytosine/adenosine deaminase-related metal-dependent hydrolase
MGDAFPIVVIVVGVVATVVAVLVAMTSGGLYERIGRGAFSLDTRDGAGRPRPGSAAARAEADEEIRQLVEAKSARRVARGEAPLDVEAEIAALTRPAAPSVDPELMEEVRQLVVARNERRMARGQEPLDVEAEVQRQLRQLGV